MPNLPPDPPFQPGAPTQPGVRPSLFRRVVSASVFCYVIVLSVLFLAMEFIGERWWPIAILLYLPQLLFLLPMIVLTPAALLADASLGTYAMLASALIIFLWHVPFYLGVADNPGPVKIKVMTNNYKENHGLALEPFIAAEDPDFIALDDAVGQHWHFEKSYPARQVIELGQFVFVSKVPVISATELEWPRWLGNPVAAVFVVPWQGVDVAIYAVHLPTPRPDFAKLAGLGLLREVAGHNRRRSDNMSFAEAMTARVQLARELAGVLAQEKRPFIALGDFNMPQDGYVHSVIGWGLVDCFQQAGRGFGFTFPGDTNNPLTLGNPWLRIDYVFGGPGWHVNECRVEPDRRSQHRAVSAELSRD